MAERVRIWMVEVGDDAAGERLDVYLARLARPELSRSRIQELIREGRVTVNGQSAKPSHRLRPGERVRVEVVPRPTLSAAPEEIPIDVVYEDEDLLVVNKPRGMVVHPAPGHPSGTLVNALLAHCRLPAGDDPIRPGIVHRLDKDTTGLVVVAKNELALRALQRQLLQREVSRKYLALVVGRPQPSAGTVRAPIARHPHQRKRMAVVDGGRPAVTHYRVVEELGEYSLLEVALETGRTHQIRVHMAHMGHPVVGDTVYGGRRARCPLLGGQALHAYQLSFRHPRTGEVMRLTASLPEDFRGLLSRLRCQAVDRDRQGC